MVESNRTVIDKDTNLKRDLAYNDIAILCRTNDNLQEIASALAEINLPIRYNRSGLLETPEGCLALACLRRLIDPLDTLATAEIHSLTTCQSPETWIFDRHNYLGSTDSKPHQWLEDDDEGPLAKLKNQRHRLPFLTPVETLRVALDAGNVRETIYRLHAVIATSLMEQENTEGVLKYHGLSKTISVETANECTNRLINTINGKFQPINYSVEYPIRYTSDTGQIVSGWIDLLLETENGLILIDHKASPRTRSDWEEIALNYSGQLNSYVEGLSKTHEKSVIGRWVHFAVMGGLVEVI